MTRVLTVAAAQLGPIARDEPRASAVARMVALMEQAHPKGVDLIVFPELALTTFFPRWFIEDEDALDASPWYLDGDGDGYGSPDSATWSCDILPGQVADGSDWIAKARWAIGGHLAGDLGENATYSPTALNIGFLKMRTSDSSNCWLKMRTSDSSTCWSP